MSKLIEAGPGKIKKKFKDKTPIHEILYHQGGFFNPFTDMEGYLERIEKARTCGEEPFKPKYIQGVEIFQRSFFYWLWMIDLKPLAELFEGSNYNYSKLPISGDERGFQYFFTDVPKYPAIELMQITIPKLQDELIIDKNKNTTFQQALPQYLTNNRMVHIWNALEDLGPDAFNMQIFFKTGKDSQVKAGLYVPLVTGDPLIHEINRDFDWHIYNVKFYANSKAEVFYHDYNIGPVVGCKKVKKCDRDQHFFHSLDDAIIKYGGRK